MIGWINSGIRYNLSSWKKAAPLTNFAESTRASPPTIRSGNAMTEEQAKDLARTAVAEFVKTQNDQTKNQLWDALHALGEFDPPSETWEGSSPARRFILSLLPKHLLRPDPFLGDSMVDCDNTRFPKLTDEQKTAVLNDLEEQLMWAEFLKQKPISAKIQ